MIHSFLDPAVGQGREGTAEVKEKVWAFNYLFGATAYPLHSKPLHPAAAEIGFR